MTGPKKEWSLLQGEALGGRTCGTSMAAFMLIFDLPVQ